MEELADSCKLDDPYARRHATMNTHPAEIVEAWPCYTHTERLMLSLKRSELLYSFNLFGDDIVFH